jgi:predicted RNA methylase
MAATQRVSERVLEILKGMEWELGICRITEKLDYAKEYKPADKVLQALGGKWIRRIKGHEFDGDGELLVRSVIDTGEYIDPKQAFQFFETPEELAERMCDMAGTLQGKSVLEPSAGKGSIVAVIRNSGAGQIKWLELDPSREDDLRGLDENSCIMDGEIGDFLEQLPAAEFDFVIMNPPFSKQQDLKHIKHAWSFLKPGGRLVAVCSTSHTFRDNKASVEFREWLEEIDAEVHDLPAGTFKSSGTMVSTCLIEATK